MTYNISLPISPADFEAFRRVNDFYNNFVAPQIKNAEEQLAKQIELHRNRVTPEDIQNADKMIIKAREYAMLDEKKYDKTAEMLYNTARFLNPSLNKGVEETLHAFSLTKRRISLADLVFSEEEIGIDIEGARLDDAPYLEDENYKRI